MREILIAGGLGSMSKDDLDRVSRLVHYENYKKAWDEVLKFRVNGLVHES